MKRIIAKWPDAPRTYEAGMMALVYAVIIVTTVVAQLFSFEKFIPLLESFSLPVSGRAVATTIVVCGVLALPFLLRMKLSSGFRWLSMGAGWAVAGIWLFLGIWMNVAEVPIDNAGLLGASVSLVVGWWVVFVALGFGILAAWAAWGLWPGRASLEHSRQK